MFRTFNSDFKSVFRIEKSQTVFEWQMFEVGKVLNENLQISETIYPIISQDNDMLMMSYTLCQIISIFQFAIYGQFRLIQCFCCMLQFVITIMLLTQQKIIVYVYWKVPKRPQQPWLLGALIAKADAARTYFHVENALLTALTLFMQHHMTSSTPVCVNGPQQPRLLWRIVMSSTQVQMVAMKILIHNEYLVIMLVYG